MVGTPHVKNEPPFFQSLEYSFCRNILSNLFFFAQLLSFLTWVIYERRIPLTDPYVFDYNLSMFAATPTHSRPEPKYHGLQVDWDMYKNLEDDGCRYDMVDGVLYVASSPFFRHNTIQANFIFSLRTFLGAETQVKIVADVDVFFPDRGDVLCPDVTVLLPNNPADTNKWIEGVPDLVVEVHSTSTKFADLRRKADRYLKNGIKEYWLVDPDTMKVQVWENRGESWAKHKDNRSRLFFGFTFQIS